MHEIDPTDIRILELLQKDATLSIEEIGESVNLSRNACWRRMKHLENAGYIRGRVALLDATRLGLPLSVFIQVRTSHHDQDWLDQFSRATSAIPEIQSVFRMSGDLDYLIRIRAQDVSDYDRIYKKLISKVPLTDVSASFVLEEIKDSHRIPL